MAANDRESATSTPSALETAGEDGPLLVNIHFVSPSEGVPDDLDFQGLPATTTVGQLKDKIRDVLTMHPAHDEQRIIHQGRLLASESATLLDVFGEEKLRTGGQQPLHLVVRTSNHHPATFFSQPAPVSGQTALTGQTTTQQDASSQNDWRADVQRMQARIDALRNSAPSGVPPATDEQIRNINEYLTGPAVRTSTSGPTNGTTTEPQEQSQPQRQQAEVYILSSPSGPRGLLIKNGSELYATPGTFQTHQTLPLPQPPLLYPGVGHPGALNYRPLHTAPQARNQPQRPQGQRQPVQVRIRVGIDHRAIGHGLGHPNNPVGAAALIAAAWPHIWLIIRLIFFIWWFTSNDSSWTRVFTMVALAAGVLAMNAGFLNRFGNQALGPIRQHLDGLLHMAAPNQQRRQHVPRPQAAHPAGANGAPDVGLAGLHEPRDMDNAGAVHLVNFFRRIERAGLLFLASIAPGVAERHIAQLEAAERERERREREEAAAAAAPNEQENQQQGDQAEQTTNNDGDSPVHNPEHVPEREIPLQAA
ncbi:hypothetical protein B0T09DRAFT_371593 [Sordaria sp. MPI-SDFR-AT-0083]|nr:hypothetical protein B0T09DRAFT_371593 [Sordaria sp. MPI-SDFR-AT-0083]